MKATLRHRKWLLILVSIVVLQMQSASAQTTTLAKEPLHSVKITVSETNFESFMERIRAIAGLSKFAYRADQMGPEKRHVFIQLWRSDVFVLVGNTFSSLDEYNMSVYNTDNSSPASKDAVRSIVDRFKAELSKVDGIQVVDMPLTRY